MIFDLMALKDRGSRGASASLAPAGRIGWAVQTHRDDRSPMPCPTGSTPDLLLSDGNGLSPFLDTQAIIDNRRIQRMTNLLRLDPDRPAPPVRESRQDFAAHAGVTTFGTPHIGVRRISNPQHARVSGR
jgi:hypothetical protein